MTVGTSGEFGERCQMLWLRGQQFLLKRFGSRANGRAERLEFRHQSDLRSETHEERIGFALPLSLAADVLQLLPQAIELLLFVVRQHEPSKRLVVAAKETKGNTVRIA